MTHIVQCDVLNRPNYRYTADGLGFLDTARPRIDPHHIDGPLLVMRDGSLHWLTLWERFMVWAGWSDALDLEAWHRPDLVSQFDVADLIPCMFCSQPVGADPVTDDHGNLACRTCGESEISAQSAERMWRS